MAIRGAALGGPTVSYFTHYHMTAKASLNRDM
jgi:hypothetical protein